MEFVSPGVSKAAVGSATNECFCRLQGVRAGIDQINHKTEAYGIFIGIAASVQQILRGNFEPDGFTRPEWFSETFVVVAARKERAFLFEG
jgi:hypothetical protein